MPRYITLLQFTEKGAKDIKKSTSRAHAFDRLAAKAGVQVEGQYWTLGGFDGVLILNADSEAAALRCLTELTAQGNVRTQTMMALVDAEFDEILKS